MGFTSILDKEESTYVNRRRPEYLLDLNLNQIIDAIQFRWIEDIRGYYRYFPENEACEAYRSGVYGDIKKEDMQRAFAGITPIL